LHLPETLIIPHWRQTLRHALPNVIEGKIVPVVLFLGLLQLAGTTPALIGALGWTLLALARRQYRRERASGLLILTTLGLTARTIAALATGSLVVYFIQPTAATGLVAAAFVGSVLLGRPLVERLITDMCPIDDETRAHPALRRFFSHASLWWGFTSAINFAITLWLLLSHSPTTFVLVKSFLGPVTTTLTLAVAYLWFRGLMARSGMRVMFAEAT
jgi:hypothetical protein